MTPELAISAALATPLIGALAIFLAGRVHANLREAVTFVTAALLIFFVWSLLPHLLAGNRPGLVAAEVLPGIAIAFSVEPLGMLFAALASALWLVNSLYSVGYMRANREHNQTRYYTLFAISLMATMGIAFAGNLFTLFLFYEILTLATYPLVSHKGDAATVRSARTYLGILLATSIGLFLPAVIWTYAAAGTGDFTPGGVLDGALDGVWVLVLLGLFVFGIGKAAVMPVHRWLPAAMVAPTPVSALLHAVAVVKAGVFAVVKIVVYIFGVDYLFELPGSIWLTWVAAITIILASVMALRQTNLKRLLAYSTVSQLSYVVMATAVLKPLAEIGAAIHMAAHALGKITLFFAAGALYTAAKITETRDLAGMGQRMPWTMAAFTIGALSMIGVPPTGGFVSKWYILAGAFQAESYAAIATVILSTVLNAAYFLPLVYMAWFAEAKSGETGVREAPLPMVIALTFTGLATIGFFFFNAPVIELERQLLGEAS
jgi:multicomponent Na+:H+ antiporter subunit D